MFDKDWSKQDFAIIQDPELSEIGKYSWQS